MRSDLDQEMPECLKRAKEVWLQRLKNHEDNNNNTHLRTALSTSVGLCKQKEEEEDYGEETE